MNNAQSKFELSILALERNMLEDALRYSSEAIGFDSSNCKFYCQRVQCLLLMKKYNAALDDCKTVRILNSKFSEICPWEFQCNVKIGDFVSAKIALDKLERLKPNHEKLESMKIKYNELSELEKQVRESAKKNDLKSVQEIVDKLVQECDGSKKIYALFVEYLITAKNLDRAKEIYTAELEGCLNDPDILYVGALMSYHSGELTSCNSTCQSLFKLAPDYGEKARTLYTKVKSLTPLTAEGSQTFKDKNFERANVIYTEALKFCSDCDVLRERYLVNRAVVNLKLENFKEAVNDCSEVIQGNEKNPKAFFNRAEAYVGLKKFDKAKEDFQKTYLLDSNESTKKRVEEAANKAKFNFDRFLDGLDNGCDQQPGGATKEPPQQQQPQKKPLDLKKLQELRDIKAKMKAAGDDFYKVLGVKAGDNLAVSKKTINRLKKTYHPDAHATYPELKMECDEIFKMILKANSEFEAKINRH